jgi:chorismate--pyruvate lyase
MVADNELSTSEQKGLNGERYLLREVLLLGDQHPWIVARTLIPDHSLNGLPYDLTQQGEVPLGLTVFQADNVRRDALEFAWVETQQGRLIARRSRLWMAQKPILVAELFLPGCPVYLSADDKKGVL